MLTSEDVRAAFKYLFPAELPLLKELVRSLPAHPFVVNIGSGSGTSGLAILESRDDVTLLTIDSQDASSPFGCLEAERDVVERAGLAHEWQQRWFQVHADSSAVAHEWQAGERLKFGGPIFNANPGVTSNLRWGKKADMVFIDGDHSYEGAKADIEGWVPLVKDGGIIAVHDYLKGDLQPDPDGPHPMPWPGVDSAVNELLIPNLPMIVHIASLVAFRREAA